MRLHQLTESRLEGRPKMGRDLNHLEDLVFFYGSDGAMEAVDVLKDITTNQEHDVSIKWDGKVALFYGRDEDGVFAMGTKGNWAKNNPAQSPDEIHDYIMNTGKGESFRPPMAKDLKAIFPHLEASVPQDFRGFVMGDMLFSPTLSPKEPTQDGVKFTPNQVTYTADTSSEIGKAIDRAICGFALHVKYDSWNGSGGSTITNDIVQSLRSTRVLTLGQSYAPHVAKLDTSAIRKLESLTKKYGSQIDKLIEKRPGLSDVSNILYTFNNQTMRGGGSGVSTEVFFKWLETSKVSANKQAKLQQFLSDNPQAFRGIFELFNAIQSVKDNIIDQLDANEADIKSTTNGERGGEGYVSLKHKVKLVPRTKWRPS